MSKKIKWNEQNLNYEFKPGTMCVIAKCTAPEQATKYFIAAHHVEPNGQAGKMIEFTPDLSKIIYDDNNVPYSVS